MTLCPGYMHRYRSESGHRLPDPTKLTSTHSVPVSFFALNAALIWTNSQETSPQYRIMIFRLQNRLKVGKAKHSEDALLYALTHSDFWKTKNSLLNMCTNLTITFSF